MASGLWTTRPKLAHHAAQPVCPIARTKGFAITGEALNKNFFDRF